MDVQAALGQLYGLERFGIKLGLENVRRLLALVGDPQAGLPAVHVTGTNGKAPSARTSPPRSARQDTGWASTHRRI